MTIVSMPSCCRKGASVAKATAVGALSGQRFSQLHEFAMRGLFERPNIVHQ